MAPADRAASIAEKWAGWAERDPRLTELAGRLAELERQTRQHLDEGRSDRGWRVVEEMRRLEQDGYGILLKEVVEHGKRFQSGGKQGRLDSLDHVLLRLLKKSGTKRKGRTAKEVLRDLKSEPGFHVGRCRHPEQHKVERGAVHRKTRDGRFVEWTDSGGGEHCVSWSRIEKHRLSRLRKRLKPPTSG
jgi:hypothetical protein